MSLADAAARHPSSTALESPPMRASFGDALGAFVAGAVTGAIVGIFTSSLLVPIGGAFAEPSLASVLTGTLALLVGASAATGWEVAFAISR